MSGARDEHDEFDDRDFTTGRLLPGHTVTVKHGLFMTTLPPSLSHLQAELDAFMAGCIADEGDINEVPARRKAQLEYRAMLHQHILQLHVALTAKGYLDARGRLRATWLQRIEGLIGAARAIDKELGLERRQKKVPNIAEWIEAQRIQGESNSPQPATTTDQPVAPNGEADIASVPAPPSVGEVGE